MKIKHICSFFALCCAMNISDLSATLSSVHKAFKSNIEKNLKGHENDIVRKCSYLNQLNTTSELWKIAYKTEDFMGAVDAAVKRVKELAGKELAGEESTFKNAFDKLSPEHKVAAVFALRFLTESMCDLKGESLKGESWIEAFADNYSEAESGVRDFVAKINGSKELKIVNNYYYNDTAVTELKKLLSKLKGKGSDEDFDKDLALNAINLVDRYGYGKVYESYRELDGKAVWEAFIDAIDEDNRKNYLLSINDKFDLLSEGIFKINDDNGVKLTNADLKEKGGFLGLLGSVREKYEEHEKYGKVDETDIKKFVFFAADEKREHSKYVARCKMRLAKLKKIAKIFNAGINLSKANTAWKVVSRGYTVTIFQKSNDEKPDKKILITNRSGVTQENYAKVLADIPKMKPPEEVAEEYKNLEIVKEAKKRWEEVKAIEAAAEQKKKEETEELTEELDTFSAKFGENCEYGKNKIEAFGDCETCCNIIEEIEEKFKKIKVKAQELKEKLGDRDEAITALAKKVEELTTKVKEAIRSITNNGECIIKESKDKKSFWPVMLRIKILLFNLNDGGIYSNEEIKKLNDVDACKKMLKEINKKFDRIDSSAGGLSGTYNGRENVRSRIEKLKNKVDEAKEEINKKKAEREEAEEKKAEIEEAETKKELKRTTTEMVKNLFAKLDDGGIHGENAIENLTKAISCDIMIKRIEGDLNEIKKNNEEIKLAGKEEVDIEELTKKAEKAIRRIIEKGSNIIEKDQKQFKSCPLTLLVRISLLWFDDGKYSKDAIKKLDDAKGCDKTIELIEKFVNYVKAWDRELKRAGMDEVDIKELTEKADEAKKDLKKRIKEINQAAKKRK